MLTRKQALLTVALMTGLPLASWAATQATTSAAAPTAPIVQPCPFGGPDADGDGMMRHGKMMKGHEAGAQRGMHMMDTAALQKQLDEIKDPAVKAKFIDMVKARLAFDQAQIEATKSFLDKQK